MHIYSQNVNEPSTRIIFKQYKWQWKRGLCLQHNTIHSKKTLGINSPSKGPKCSVQCTVLYTLQCAVYSVFIAVYNRQCAHRSVQWSVCTKQCAVCLPHLKTVTLVYIVQCTIKNVHCTAYSVQCKVYSVQCTVYNVQCTLYSVKFTVYSVKCTVYNVQCTLYSVQ